MDVWLNGSFVPADEARVSVFDAGFQHAVGLFETIGGRHGRPFRALAHVRRLIGSATTLRLTETLRERPLVEAIGRAIEHNGLDASRVRVTLTGGDLQYPRKGGDDGPADPTILIVAQPATPYPPAMFTDGVRVVEAMEREAPLNHLAGHKTTSYWHRIQALQGAAARGAGEAIWFSITGHLASGCVSNVFLVKDGELHTPVARGEEAEGVLPSTVLPGITRAAVMELAETMGLTVHRRPIAPEEILPSDEMFLTNASWGVLPVVGVLEHDLGAGTVGPVTQSLRERWLALVDRETGG
ncbi:MAG: aminotransferase class IV family protein [Phycisphaerales bacterium]|nr:aminotransferase class IV family protein [Phycisphaerales bacterium]